MIEVIIPNWNGLEVLPDCLESLSKQTFPAFRVTLADNASSDGSVEYVREHFPDVNVFSLPRNLGFCGAVNAAIRRSTADLHVLLNNDAEADCGWLAELYQAQQRHPRAGSFASKVLMHHDPGLLESAGDMLEADGSGRNRGRGQRDQGQYEQEEEVFSASACAALYRRSLFEKIGLLDESFFAYFEDIDLGYRAQRFGLPCIYVPRARVLHRGKQTRPEDRHWHLTQEFVNTTLCLIKNLPSGLTVRNFKHILGSHLRSLKGLLKVGGPGLLAAAETKLLKKTPGALCQRLTLARAWRGPSSRLSMFLPREYRDG